MANLSSAYGTITLKGSWNKKQIKLLIEVFDMLSKGYYNIELMNPDTLYTEGYTSGFGGTGRWSFMGNLRNFNDWILQDTEEYSSTTANKLIKEMFNNKLTIHWAVRDEEAGVGFIHIFEGRHEASDLTSLEFKTEMEEEHDHNLKNMMEYYNDDEEMFYDIIFRMKDLLNIDEDHIEDVLKQDPNWWNISSWVHELEDIPTDFLKAVGYDSTRTA